MRRASTSAIAALTVVSALVLGALVLGAFAQQTANTKLAPLVSLEVETDKPGSLFRAGAVGLSIEARELGTTNLSASHYRLVRMMRLLGPSLLRIGGNSVDLSWWTSNGEPPPSWATNVVTPADLNALHGLLRAADWRVLLGVNLGHFEPARAADEARVAKAILGSELAGIEIGNEPNGFDNVQRDLRPATYDLHEYVREAGAYQSTIGVAASGVAVYGPALSAPRWLTEMGAGARMFAQLTQHFYPINVCPMTSPAAPRPTATELLAPTIRQQEDQVLKGLTLAGTAAGRSTRIGETNSVACGGNDDASPGFAGALWSLDWVLRAASVGAAGLNFHGGFGACRSYRESPICASSPAAAQVGKVTAQANYYGLLAARQLESGRFVPVRLISPRIPPNLTIWATLSPHGSVKIAIDNLATTGSDQPVSIPASGFRATEIALVAPSIDANGGIILGSNEITSAGEWRPTSISVYSGRTVHVVVQPGSAVIVTLRTIRASR